MQSVLDETLIWHTIEWSGVLVEYIKMFRTIIRFTSSILSIGFTLCQLGNAVAIEADEFANKIAFLSDGEVWVCDRDGRRVEQLTKTAGRVEDFLFCPALKYVSYSQIIKYVDEPGLWEEGERIPQRAVCSIVVMELKDEKVLKEIMPPKDNWIYPVKWLPNERLLFYGASGFDVWGFFEYDIQKGIELQVDYAKGSILSNADFHLDGFLMAYVDCSGVGEEFREDLHLVDLESNDDRTLLSKKSILEPRISYDKTNVAFVEVEYLQKQSFDNLWIYDVKGAFAKRLYRGFAKAKSAGVSELSWSFNDRHIGMFFSPEALVIEIQNPGNIHKIRGTDFNWIGNKEIVFTQGKDVYLYNLDTRETELFFKNASKPVFLRKKD